MLLSGRIPRNTTPHRNRIVACNTYSVIFKSTISSKVNNQSGELIQVATEKGEVWAEPAFGKKLACSVFVEKFGFSYWRLDCQSDGNHTRRAILLSRMAVRFEKMLQKETCIRESGLL